MNVFTKVFIVTGLLSVFNTYAFDIYFKYPFVNVSKCTSEFVDYSSKDKYEIIKHFTHKNEVWRVDNYIYHGDRKSLNGFVNFDGMNYEKYNHKKAKIEIGNLLKKDNHNAFVSITNSQGEQIGLKKYVFNESGFVLSITQSFFNSTFQKEIKSINSYIQYNCYNQLVYYTVNYEYYTSSHKYKRKVNEAYKVNHCNPDKKNNYQDVYFYRLYDNILIKKENRIFKYVS